MFKFSVTDRRLNPGGKSHTNRQRFLERVKQSVRDAANKQIKGRNIQDQSEAEVSISRDGIDEPVFHYDSKKGVWNVVLPGNRDYVVGDTIPKPQEGGGGGGTEGSPDGDGEDEFRFYISYDEFVNAILEDLSLPDMVKASEKESVSFSMRRAGYTTVGAASNLALERTMIHGIGRRIALKTPKLVRIRELEEEWETADEARRLEIEDEIESLRRRAEAISFLEKADLRYNNFIKQPNPMTKAVVFFVMDVSGSMGEREKTIAKKYFILLYLFLCRKYKEIHVVFIRHHHVAEECDQETFFTKPETGGTVVSTAYDEMLRIIQERYNVADWNIYMAQASDGDNSDSDNPACHAKLGRMLPWMQYATYVEIGRDHVSDYFQPRETTLWKMMDGLQAIHANLALRKITDEKQVIETFRSLFQSKPSVKAAA